MNLKIKKVQELLGSKNLAGIVITNPVNIFYLTGFAGFSHSDRESMVAISKKPVFITARLYQNEAKKLSAQGFKIKIVPERHLMFEEIKKIFKSAEEIGFEENDLKYSEFKNISKSLKNLFPVSDLIEDLRILKTKDEIEKIEKAQIISQKAFYKLIQTLKVGQTEKEIADKLRTLLKAAGADDIAFQTIVASGPNSGKPHHDTGNRKIRKGDALLLDFGAKYKNYRGDLSRTVFVGKAKDTYKNIYRHVQEAQATAIEKINADVTASDLYHVTNNYFKGRKLDKYFLHGLGHGIGLEVHESPILRQSIKTKIAETMVFSVEPGLYFPWGGVRIEDLVVIKNGKAKVLGKMVDELIELDI